MLEQNLVTTLLKIKNTSSKTQKQQIVKENADTPLLKEALVFMLNPFTKIGISTISLSKNVEPIQEYTEFNTVLEYLIDNPTGSNKSIAILLGYLNQFDDTTKSVLSEVFAKSLSVGMSAKSVNKAFNENLIPIFDVQLAFSVDKYIHDITEDEKLYVTQKLDGTRCIVKVQNETSSCELYSRKGIKQEGFDELENDILSFIRKNQHLMQHFPNGIVLDGELLLKNTKNLSVHELFRASAKEIRKKGQKSNIQLNIFDCIPLDEFLTSETSSKPYSYRRESWLNAMIKTDLVGPIPLLGIITKDQIQNWATMAKQNKWEGVMLNRATGLYAKKRSKDILKVKQMKSADVEIVGFNQAIEGKFKGKLKSLIVSLGNGTTTDVGFGISDKLKTEIWDNQDFYLGKMIEIQYFQKSENQKGGEALRHAGFTRFRFDKTPDDTNIE